jgi:hypothetical protein
LSTRHDSLRGKRAGSPEGEPGARRLFSFEAGKKSLTILDIMILLQSFSQEEY